MYSVWRVVFFRRGVGGGVSFFVMFSFSHVGSHVFFIRTFAVCCVDLDFVFSFTVRRVRIHFCHWPYGL